MKTFWLVITSLVVFQSIQTAVADDWNQWRGNQRDGVWRETGILESFGDQPLQPVWKAPVAGGYSGPTVADGRVFVMDKITGTPERERVLCFDEKTGKPLWDFSYPVVYDIEFRLGPRTSVTVIDGMAYSFGAMGYAVCFNAKTGEVHWERDLQKLYNAAIPGWGISSSPLVYENTVIYQIGGADGACIVALNVTTGEEEWRALDEKCSYSSPVIIEQGGRDVLVCWTGGSFSGLNPRDGSVYWSHPFKPTKMVINVATPVYDGNYLFFTSFYDGAWLLKVNHETMGIEEVWARSGRNEKNTDAIQSIISTPVIDGEYIYGVDSYGELRCLEKMTGNRVWEDLTAVANTRWGTIFFVKHEDRWFMFNEAGELMIGKLSPQGYEEVSRTRLIKPTSERNFLPGTVCWMHPAFANQHIFIRNDKEIICYSLKQ